MRLSIVIAAKSKTDPKLARLLKSIEDQHFDKHEREVLIITEGTSESAKAIGIRRAKGDVIGILASDNVLISPKTLGVMTATAEMTPCYPARYHYDRTDDALNRYFALIGGNDPLSFYMGKNDRVPYYTPLDHFGIDGSGKSVGDNGFFIKKSLIENTDLDNYYHVDNANEAGPSRGVWGWAIKHDTGGNIFTFFKKRYRYGLQHAFNKNRRWHLVERKDIPKLIWFILCSITLFQPLSLSWRGFRKIQDAAWFMHPLVCLMSVITYGILVMHLGLRRLYQSLSAPLTVRRA